MPKLLAFTVFVSASILPVGATVVSYATLNAAVTANGDTLLEGAGFRRHASNQEYLSNAGSAPNYNLTAVGGVSNDASEVFVFAYDAVNKQFEFTLNGITYTDAAAPITSAQLSHMGGFYFELDRPNSGVSASVTGLSLLTYDQSSPLFLDDTSYSLSGSATTGAGYIASTFLANGFYLTGTVNLQSTGTKSQFRVFTGSTPVPEASAFAFGAALVGGLILVEHRRRSGLAGSR